MLDFTQVELIDPESDATIGVEDKLEAHVNGNYHRAISVLIVDGAGKHLIQQRAMGKYHCPELWANACCSHPAPGESSDVAAKRRLREELGIEGELFHFGVLRYRASVPSTSLHVSDDAGLIEHERVDLFCMQWDGECNPNPDEVQNTTSLGQSEALEIPPQERTPWFSLYLELFGEDLPKIVAACTAGSWTHRDYGKYDLD